MDSEPFVATPEKPGAVDIKGESLTTFKRSLFGEAASHEHITHKEIKGSDDGVGSIKAEASSWSPKRANSSLQKDDFSFGFKPHNTSTQAQPERVTDTPECGHSDLLGSFRMKGPADSQQGDKQKLTELRSREEPRIRGTLSANQRPSSESTVPHTPIKARRLDIDSGSGAIFTPPPAPATRPVSFASSPITPLVAANHAQERRVSRKKSAKLKALSMQLKQSSEDSQECSTEASTSSPEGDLDASPPLPAGETSAAHPYALLASAQPAQELTGDPKYRGMAALGCQHQYTDDDRNNFLRRRERIVVNAAGSAEVS